MKHLNSALKIRLALTITLLSSGLSPAQEFDFIDLFPQKQGIACYRIPSIVTAPNGDLITAIDERVSSCADLRDNKNINLKMNEEIFIITESTKESMDSSMNHLEKELQLYEGVISAWARIG